MSMMDLLKQQVMMRHKNLNEHEEHLQWNHPKITKEQIKRM